MIKITLTILCFVLVFGGNVFASNYCVGPSATGNGSGSDWDNQAAWSSITLSRGNEYYLADGSYGGKTLSTANSGTTQIKICKAQSSTVGLCSTAHGPDTGWQSTYGDGQAQFTSSISVQSSYWIFDGVVPTTLWSKTPSSYGFYFNNIAEPLSTYNTSATVTNVTLSHIAAIGPTSDTFKIFWGTNNSTGSVNNFTLSHCYASNFANFQWGTSPGPTHSNWITEYNVFMDVWSSAAIHGEQLNNNFAMISNWVIRYNWIEGIANEQPTMIVGALNNSSGPYYIYGNVFKDLEFSDGGICAVSNGYGSHSLTGAVYNNTLINCRSYYGGISWVGGAGNNSMTVQNNLLYNMPAIESTSGTYSYNAYFDCTSIPTETSGYTSTGDPFTNSSGGDYTLKIAVATAMTAGNTLSSPYNQDTLGNIRGNDGKWDRGAYEYVSGVPSAPKLLGINAAKVNGITPYKVNGFQ